MSTRGEQPRQRGAKSPTLPERVAQFYYSHGLFCSTYPTTVIFIAISVVLLCCYPLLSLPLSGSTPLQVKSAGPNVTLATQAGEQPWVYIQQVVLRTAVVPWDENLTLGDAFRAPLYEAFKLLDIVRNYQNSASKKTLGHVCLHVEAVKKSKDPITNILPEYSCLVLSPANLWQQDAQQFSQDTSILSTIFSHQNLQKGKTSIAEMLFGMHLIDTGIKRYPLRNRQRILQYAVTLFLKHYDEQFISGLRHKLQTDYPLHQNNYSITSADNSLTLLNDTVLIHYAGDVNYIEYVPLVITFILLFIYYYFSVRKIEMIRSKFGMACTVVITVLGSLTMTLGLCFFFGLTFSMQGKGIFPYLIVLVGIENVLVLTKSVESTPTHLDIKIRVAQGLSKEGWSITKNLLLELTILTAGIFTFVPVIQEFCIFSVVGLITDFFLQMLFFSTVLSVDTRKTENLRDKTNASFRSNLYQPHIYFDKNFSPKSGISRSKSHPRLNTMHTDVVASQVHEAKEKKIPKRLRLVNIWARTRFFQRAFMILMVVWISMIVYNSGIIEKYFIEKLSAVNTTEVHSSKDPRSHLFFKYNSSINLVPMYNKSERLVDLVTPSSDKRLQQNHSDELLKLKHPDYSPWLRLSTQHWPAILRKYNLSLSGKYVAVLPNIRISHAVTPEQAVLLRNVEDKYGHKFQWQALAAALDPIDFSDLEGNTASTFSDNNRPFYPTSPMEIFLTTILCTISIIVLAYVFVVLYRTICTRNYAEWRASWFSEKLVESEVPVLLEAVPIVLDGHQQVVECLATDGFTVVSSCLGGNLKVWDTAGGLLAHIDRKMYFSGPLKSPNISVDVYDDNNLSDYESGSPPSRDEYLTSFPSLQHKINTNFSNVKWDSNQSNRDATKFNFGEEYNQIYLEHDRNQRLRQRTNNETVRSSDTAKWVDNHRQISSSSYHCDISNSNSTNDSNVICGKIKKTQSCEKLGDNKTNGGETVRTSITSDFGGSAGAVNTIESVEDSQVWCIDYLDNLIVIGCKNGRLEVWEGTTGKFKCMYDDASNAGITSLKIMGSRVVAARLHGGLDFLQLQTYSQGRPIDWNFTSAYRRTHMRTGSTGSISDYKDFANQQNECKEDMRCLKITSKRAHQQPVTCLESEGGRVVSGSKDHTLKVFRLEDGSPLYTLHGHYGPITCLFIDRVNPATAGSGSQDGTLCVWDLLTGTCVYNIHNAHNGSITSLTYSASYVITLGQDERLCVWERFQGHLLKAIQYSYTYTSNILMLTPSLVLIAQTGGLIVFDVQSGETVRNIVLRGSPLTFIKQILMLRDAVVCDFGNQLRIVRFPVISHKVD